MRYETPHTLDHLREVFGPFTAEQSTPPSAEELAQLRRVIPGIAIEADRIVLPLRPPPSFISGFKVVAWVYALSSIGAIALAVWTSFSRPVLPWFLIHTAVVMPPLIVAAYRTRYRGELVIFPSSPLCRVQQGTLILESFFHGSLFRGPQQTLGVAPHIGIFLIKNARRPHDEQARAAAVLNRYVLFGARTREPPGPGPAPVLAGVLGRWLLEVPKCESFDQKRLVFRVLPHDVAFKLGSVFFWCWAYFGGACLVDLSPELWRLAYGISLGFVLILWWGYRWEHKRRLASLAAGQRRFEVRQPNGVVKQFVVDSNPFETAGGGESDKVLVLLEPLVSPGRSRKRHRLAVGDDDEIRDELVVLFGEYLGFPPRNVRDADPKGFGAAHQECG
jgi:hypothetical protein